MDLAGSYSPAAQFLINLVPAFLYSRPPAVDAYCSETTSRGLPLQPWPSSLADPQCVVLIFCPKANDQLYSWTPLDYNTEGYLQVGFCKPLF